MKISLSDHFNYKRLLHFVLPTIIMMIFTSLYSIVDGLFVSNIVGKNALATVNLIMPVNMCVAAFGFMVGTGGSALVAKKLGEGEEKTAKKLFSLFIAFALVLGTFLSALCFIFMPKIAIMLGASSLIIDDCILYGRVLMAACPFFILQNTFQNFLVTAEKPKLGLIVTVIAGLGNIFFDFLLVYVFNLGLLGAAIATASCQFLGAIIPTVYFFLKNKSRLHFVKPELDIKNILKGCSNGASELLSNLSLSLVSMLYNLQLIKFAAENGLAAYGVIMYVSFTFIAIFIGYNIGCAPLISFNYGAKNELELKNLFKKSVIIISIASIIMTVLGISLAHPLSSIFVGYDKSLLEMTSKAMQIYSFSFIITGFNIFASMLFTALNDGKSSAIISVMRTLVFQVISILVLPALFGLDGIWFSVLFAEILSLIVSLSFIVLKRKKFNYV